MMQVAGGPGESVMQPLWAGNQLYFISDRTDFWNIYTETADGKVRPLQPKLHSCMSWLISTQKSLVDLELWRIVSGLDHDRLETRESLGMPASSSFVQSSR